MNLTWCVLRPFVVRRGSAALGTAPEIAWLPLEGQSFATRDEAVRAATRTTRRSSESAFDTRERAREAVAS